MFNKSRLKRIKADRRTASRYLGRWNKDVKPKESKLDPIIKEKWLTALRSGEYVQTENALRHEGCNGSSFCCLGVLTDILDPDGWEKGKIYGRRVHRFKGSKYENDSYPNQNAMKEVGLYKSTWKKLAELNDDGMSFKEIANHIERNL